MNYLLKKVCSLVDGYAVQECNLAEFYQSKFSSVLFFFFSCKTNASNHKLWSIMQIAEHLLHNLRSNLILRPIMWSGIIRG